MDQGDGESKDKEQVKDKIQKASPANVLALTRKTFHQSIPKIKNKGLAWNPRIKK